jgi:glycopeptide antibiotics resistance protein
LTEFQVSSVHFFFIGAGVLICANAAVFVIRVTGGLAISARREIVKWIFSLYLLIVASLAFFPVRYEVTGAPPPFAPADVNLVLFKTVIETFGVLFSEFSVGFKLHAIFSYVAGSFLLLLPFGFLLPQLSIRLRSYFYFFSAALVLSLAIMSVQFFEVSYGVGDGRFISIDTLALNVAGALIGFHCWRALRKKYC